MKRFQNALIGTLFIITTFTCCIPTPGGGGTVIPTTTYTEIKDTSYGADPQQKMDIYLPAGRTTTNTKTIVLVHGGGWQQGDKSEQTFTALINRIKITAPEVAIVNLNYRLVTGANSAIHLPEILSDISSAFAFLKSNKTNFGISNSYGIWGFSAGAHIATLYAYAYDTNNDIKAVSDWYGPMDFATPQPGDISIASLLAGKNIYAIQKELLGAERSANPQLWFDASPLNKVTANSKPTIMIHNEADPTVPYNDSYFLNEKLNLFNVNHSLINIGPFIANHPINFLHFQTFHDFADPTSCSLVDCSIINDTRNYTVDTTLHYMKRFL